MAKRKLSPIEIETNRLLKQGAKAHHTLKWVIINYIHKMTTKELQALKVHLKI